MITIPTYELLGMIADMLPFVDSDKDSAATHCVRIEQADDTLTMLATNRSQMFRVTWTPEDPELGLGLGSFDVRVTPADAKVIANAFKLPEKLSHAPLTVSASRVMASSDHLYRLKITRDADALWPATTVTVTGWGVPNVDEGDSPEIDIHGTINALGRDDRVDAMLTRTGFNPKLLANLGKVERHGVVKMSFCSGRDGAPMYVHAGKRFDGVMFPAKLESGQ